MKTAKIAIIGRPNVGKSSLFNVLLRRKAAIVEDTPGITRDRNYSEVENNGTILQLIDTAGIENFTDDGLAKRMNAISKQAIKESDAVIFLIDGKYGLVNEDEQLAAELQKSGRKIFMVINKCDLNSAEDVKYESYALGFGEPLMISAEHRRGIKELKQTLYDFTIKINEIFDEDHIVQETLIRKNRVIFSEDTKLNKNKLKKALKEAERLFDDVEEVSDDVNYEEPAIEIEEPTDDLWLGAAQEESIDNVKEEPIEKFPIRLALVGRPNAGKSTIVNALTRQNRMLTGDEAGLTRESISTLWEYKGQRIDLIDTAGVRKKAKVNESIEEMSVSSTMRTIRGADIVCLMIDATDGIQNQDRTIASRAVEQGKPIIILLNKWDIVENKDEVRKEAQEILDFKITQVKNIPMITLSALTSRGVNKLMPEVFDLYIKSKSRIPTSELNILIKKLVSYHTPPRRKNREVKIKYITQIGIKPPTFALWANLAEELPASYMRYLENGLRDVYELDGVPLEFKPRSTMNPFAKKISHIDKKVER
ncbi:MAG: ribosome biogenesis GTPase Der [Proteobacteria bacterium]|nr:ribosome biogenesis GTPase Der [Pseudomonadota bacterium]